MYPNTQLVLHGAGGYPGPYPPESKVPWTQCICGSATRHAIYVAVQRQPAAKMSRERARPSCDGAARGGPLASHVSHGHRCLEHIFTPPLPGFPGRLLGT